MQKNKEWFASWFDSPYYHILYKNRDEAEAQLFIKNLVQKLQLTTANKIVDLACGKGRHSVELNKYNLDVLGLDLSKNSIDTANLQTKEGLKFDVHDMREPFGTNEFDAVLNLFTSIGYFNDNKENRKVFEAVHHSLKPRGWFVIDFFNRNKVLNNLVSSETKTIDGILFQLNRNHNETSNIITKTITFEAENTTYQFEEKVQALSYHTFEILLRDLFTIEAIFGDYQLNGFDAQNSNRLILVCKKR